MAPDLNLLAQKLDVDLDDLATKARSIREEAESIDTLTAEETTILLLDRLNILIATDMGEDFELGHGLVWNVVDASADNKWTKLISAWDHVLLPQVMERYAGRNDTLRELLKVGPESETREAFCERTQIGSDNSIDAPLKLNFLRDMDVETAQNILRHLAT